jgi:uncharacterized RDD family membrane protein YckC
MNIIDEYVRQVMDHVPPALSERGRIELDLRAHLHETFEAEGSAAEAIRRMGQPADVARAYVAEIPLAYASFPTRVLAFLIDCAVGVAVLLVVLALAGTEFLFGLASGPAPSGDAVALSMVAILVGMVAVALLSLAYFPVLEWRFGQTLGKKLVAIHVVREDGTRIGLLEAIVRRIPFFLEFFWIDAVVALFSQRHQRAFDLVARTIVVRCESALQAQPAAAAPHVA